MKSLEEQRASNREKAKRHYWRDVEKSRTNQREYKHGYYRKNKININMSKHEYYLKNKEDISHYGYLLRLAFPERFIRPPLAPEKREEYRRREVVKRLAAKFGITIAERDALFSANDGLCHICSKVPSEVIDHHHDTSRVRGALCHSCNKMLGFAKDDTEVLLLAADYLRRETCVIS